MQFWTFPDEKIWNAIHKAREAPTTPNNILLIGLAIQAFSFATFLMLLVLFLVKERKAIVQKVSRRFLVALIVVSLLLYLRTCVRSATASEGLFGVLRVHEAMFIWLNFFPVVMAVVGFNIVHPDKCIPIESC